MSFSTAPPAPKKRRTKMELSASDENPKPKQRPRKTGKLAGIMETPLDIFAEVSGACFNVRVTSYPNRQSISPTVDRHASASPRPTTFIPNRSRVTRYANDSQQSIHLDRFLGTRRWPPSTSRVSLRTAIRRIPLRINLFGQGTSMHLPNRRFNFLTDAEHDLAM